MMPKSTAQHRQDGTYQPCRHGSRSDVDLAVGSPLRPAWLKGDARQLWDVVTGNLPDGAQAAIDTATLAGCCWWWGRWNELRKQVESGTGDDYKIAVLMASAWKQFAVLAAKFGMSPVDRTKLKVEGGATAENALERLLKSRMN